MVLIWSTVRYHFTGRFWDILKDLAEIRSFPESHGSPSESNNKRVFGSVDPAEFPPPDNMSNTPQISRGPVAGSKRVSLSLDSARRGATSTVNGTNASSPIFTTTAGTQGDLSIPSLGGSVSTPEKTDGLGTSAQSSPITLTRIFDNDTIPITTNDLGRLPLHHGVKFPTNFNFGEIANGLNASGSGRTSTALGGVQPSPGLSRGDGANSRGTRAGVTPSLHPPQEQHPEDLFPWMPYTGMTGAEETTTNSVPALATATKPNVASTYATVGPDQSQQTADRLDSTISSLFGDVPSTSSTALGQMAGLLPGPASTAARDHTDLFDALFSPPDPPVEAHPTPTMQTAQQPHDEPGEQEFGGLPANTQAYLQGWSNAPQAFE